MTMCDRLKRPLRNWKNVGIFIIEIHIGSTAYIYIFNRVLSDPVTEKF